MKVFLFFLSLLFLVITFSCNKDDENTQIITESINPVTDIPYIIFEDDNDLVEQLDLALPIPTNDKVYIALGDNDTIQSLELYSITGKLFLETKSTEIDFSNLPAGMYLLKIKTDKGIAIKKVIKE